MSHMPYVDLGASEKPLRPHAWINLRTELDPYLIKLGAERGYGKSERLTKTPYTTLMRGLVYSHNAELNQRIAARITQTPEGTGWEIDFASLERALSDPSFEKILLSLDNIGPVSWARLCDEVPHLVRLATDAS